MLATAAIKRQGEAWLAELRSGPPAILTQATPHLEHLRDPSTPRHLAYEHFLRDPAGERIRWADMHVHQIEHIQTAHAKGYHAGVLAPLGHGKTTLHVVGATLDDMGLYPDWPQQIVSASGEIAQDRLEAVMGYVELSDAYRELYPWVRPAVEGNKRKDWSKTSLTIDRKAIMPDPTLRGVGVVSKRTGSRTRRTRFDDIEDIDSLSQAVRKARANAVWNKWLRRIDPPHGRAVWVGTPQHVEDLNHVLVRTPGWSVLIQAVRADFKGIEWVVVENPRPEVGPSDP